jgi:hypothetical protein
MERPMSNPAIIGTQKEMFGYEVHLIYELVSPVKNIVPSTNRAGTYANQKKEMVNNGEAYNAISKRNSGGTARGAHLAASFSYLGLKMKIYLDGVHQRRHAMVKDMNIPQSPLSHHLQE